MIRLTTEQAQQIEEALEDIVRVFRFETGTPVEALAAIRVARAQEQAEQEPVASVDGWVARPHPEDIKRLEEQRSIGHWDSNMNDVCWREGLVNADLQHGQPLYTHPVRTKELTDEQKQLARFYQVETLSELVAAMEKHIEKLQARIKYQPVYLRTPREG